MRDIELEQERHRRRLLLMQMMGETNRMELWRNIMITIAVGLATCAVLFSVI